MLEEVKELYSSYTDKVMQLKLNKKLTDGIFGMGTRISDDPCHEEFAKALEDLLKRFEESSPGSSEVRELLEYIYLYPYGHKDIVSVYWMTTAVHSLTLDIIKLLDAKSASELRKQYITLCPKLKQLPVQKKICRALAEISK